MVESMELVSLFSTFLDALESFVPQGSKSHSYWQFKRAIEVFAQLYSIWRLQILSHQSVVCLILQFLRSWMSHSEPDRITKNVSGAVVSRTSVVSTNCFGFLSPSEARWKEWKGTPQRESTCIAAVFPASQVNSTDDRLSALMDGMVTFSLFGSQCVPSPLFLSLAVWSPFGPV